MHHRVELLLQMQGIKSGSIYFIQMQMFTTEYTFVYILFYCIILTCEAQVEWFN